jgi:hypothetical protein
MMSMPPLADPKAFLVSLAFDALKGFLCATVFFWLAGSAFIALACGIGLFLVSALLTFALAPTKPLEPTTQLAPPLALPSPPC